MDEPAPSEDKHGKTTLVERLTGLATAAMDAASADRGAAQAQLTDLLQSTRTVALLPALNAAIVPGRVPDAARVELMGQLARLPMRPDGVRATLEFVFSVHPSTGSDATAGKPQKEGASITAEALTMATQLLARPAQRVAPDAWFAALAPQLLALLDGHDGLDLAKVAAYVVGFGVLGRKVYGAPGAPGWVRLAEPMLRTIDPTISLKEDKMDKKTVVDLGRNAAAVLVPDGDVAQGLRRLQMLVMSHPNPGLARRLLGGIVLPLWALASWTNASRRMEDDYGIPARNLLKIYLKLATAADRVMPIVHDLLFEGRRDPGHPPWEYRAADAAGDRICIVSAPETPRHPAEVLQTRWNEIGPKSDALIELLAAISTDDDDITAVFLDLFGRWLQSKKPGARLPTVLVKQKDEDADDAGVSALASVLEGSILQKMMETFPDKLAGRPDHILSLVEGLLRQVDPGTLASDDTLPVQLSLLNLVVTSPGFRRAKADPQVVASVEASLQTISEASGSESADNSAQTARNLLLLLQYRDELDESDGPAPTSASTSTSQQIEDRKTYSLAMGYIVQADAPPPVRVEGLVLLEGLVAAGSPVLDIAALLVLLSSLLDDSEDYVNLRVVQLFARVAARHPASTTRELLEHYVDAQERKGVDARLRFGEALLQVVQRLGATFAGDTARQVGEALLEVAGRRAHRAKTEAKQAREARLQELRQQKKAADGAYDDDDVRRDVDDALQSDADKERNAILSRIVDGWQSTRGSDDVRVRASALSILGTAIEVNIAGLGATLASGAVDLAMNVLTMETGPETAILRRAAIVLVLSFVRALAAARDAGRALGFGLTQASQDDIVRVLAYVAATDDDGLVKQHAADVIESLENWKVASLLPRDDGSSTGLGSLGGLTKLAGLRISPTSASTSTTTSNSRPRIEEVE